MKECPKCRMCWEDSYRHCGECGQGLADRVLLPDDSTGAVIQAFVHIAWVSFMLWLAWPFLKSAVAWRMTQ